MTGSTHLSTWVDADTKQRFSSAAARQGLSESALLKRLIEQMLATGPAEVVDDLVPQDADQPRPLRRPAGEAAPRKHL